MKISSTDTRIVSAVSCAGVIVAAALLLDLALELSHAYSSGENGFVAMAFLVVLLPLTVCGLIASVALTVRGFRFRLGELGVSGFGNGGHLLRDLPIDKMGADRSKNSSSKFA